MTEEIIVSTGVKFGIRDVPVMAFRDLQKRLERERPHAPVLYIEEKDREEINEDDPDYQQKLQEWNEMSEMKLLDFVLMTGSVVNEMPDNIRPVDSEDWAEECRFLGIEVPNSGGVRYLEWIKYVACPTQEDIKMLILGAGRKLGVTEDDVADTAAMFQNREERRANRTAPRKTRGK